MIARADIACNNYHMLKPRNAGFSLVELSIVLVIIGLLVGGILAGQSLIRAGELRKISTQADQYITAVHAFRDKYFALPGDFSRATSIWGTDPDGCPNNATRTRKIPTCDGDANGTINGTTSSGSEGLRFWQHLANAGLIPGTYSGTGGAGASSSIAIGENIPAGIPGTGWWIRHLGDWPGGSGLYITNYGNIQMDIAGADSADTAAINPFLTPAEAWNIDTKRDDGMPGRGKLLARRSVACNTNSDSDLTSPYKLDNDVVACSFIFRDPF